MAPPVANKPYFVPHRPGTSDSVRDAGDGVDVEELPASVDPDDFAPKFVNIRDDTQMTPLQKVTIRKTWSQRPEGGGESGGTLTTFDASSGGTNDEKLDTAPLKSTIQKIFGSKSRQEGKFSALNESAKKAAPKLFFSGERTFLSWMHAGIMLAGISMAMSAHTDTGSAGDLVALLLLPVAIGIMVYSMLQFSKRSYMIATRSPGPYEDRYGPVVVGSVFVVSLLAQLFVVLAQRS